MDTYYNPADLANFSDKGTGAYAKDLWSKFMNYYGSVFQDGALSAREKSLIALGVAASVQCPYCIDAYTNDLLKKGCDADEILEVFHVTEAIRGGAALAHSVQAVNIIRDNEL